MAAVLGAGPVADAFLVAFRLPNHFRAIFAEGAFAAAFVPAYARIRDAGRRRMPQNCSATASSRCCSASQIVLLALALALHAGGDPRCSRRVSATTRLRFELAVELTRITFPYLLLMTLVTLYLRHPQFDRPLRDRRRGADPAQPHHGGDARDRGVLPDRRPCGRLGRADRRRARSAAGRRRGAARRRDDRAAPSEARRRREALLQGARARDRRLGRRAACAVRRHHHRELPRRRRALGALLRRPALSASRRRDRHRGRHRAAARNGAAASRPATTRARAPRRRARSSSRCCSRSRASRRFWSCPT